MREGGGRGEAGGKEGGRREGGREISAVSAPKEHIVSSIALAMGFALLASAISVYQAYVKHNFKYIKHMYMYIYIHMRVCVCAASIQTGKLLARIRQNAGCISAIDE